MMNKLGLVLVVMTLVSSASAITYSMSSDAGSSSNSFDSGLDGSVRETILVDPANRDYAHSVSGSGSFKDAHDISYGDRSHKSVAHIGVNIKDAEYYSYGYRLKQYRNILYASEHLDVDNAKYIYANADASNTNYYRYGEYVSKGEDTGILLVGPRKFLTGSGGVSLYGYSNEAVLSLDGIYMSTRQNWENIDGSCIPSHWQGQKYQKVHHTAKGNFRRFLNNLGQGWFFHFGGPVMI